MQCEQSGAWPPNVRGLHTDHWPLLLVREVEAERWAAIVAALFSTEEKQTEPKEPLGHHRMDQQMHRRSTRRRRERKRQRDYRKK